MDERIGHLYIIRNDVNEYIYIGKTYKDIQNRFREHIVDSNKHYDKFHKAIKEIGDKHFYIEELGSFRAGYLEQAEVDAIREYNSLNTGYNSTIGGEIGSGYQFTDDDMADFIFLYTECGMSINQIAKEYGYGPHVIQHILLSYGVNIRTQNTKEMMELLDHKVYGVQRKTGQMVQFDNEYYAALEIYNAGLSVQEQYFIKNDILRSIRAQGSNYGVAGYLWFDNLEDAKLKQIGINEHSYITKEIHGSILTEAIRAKQKPIYIPRDTYSSNSAAIEGREIPSNEFNLYPPSNDELLYLISQYSLNKIGDHYNKPFVTIKKLCRRLGLPSTKEEIASFREEQSRHKSGT